MALSSNLKLSINGINISTAPGTSYQQKQIKHDYTCMVKMPYLCHTYGLKSKSSTDMKEKLS